MNSVITWRRDGEVCEFGGVLRRWLDRRRLETADAARVSELARRFLAVAGGVGLSRDTSSCAGIPGLSSPRVRHVVLGAVETITVEMLPGQLVADYAAEAESFAEGLGCHSVEFTRRRHGYLTAVLRPADPLVSAMDLPRLVVRLADDDAFVAGLLETGLPLRWLLADMTHVLVQGSTGSGKSRWCYGWLSQLAGCADVRISGSDVTGLLLRPFVGTRHGDLLALGTGSIEDHAGVLEALVKVMDERISRIPDHLDYLPVSEEDPYEVVVLEELPGLLAAAAAADAVAGVTKAKGLVTRIQSAYGRLIAEGRKVGFRLLVLMQRADASIIGGFAREQAPWRITFPVLSPEAVKLLHPAVDQDVALAHVTALPGFALVSGPGLPVCRMRAPEMGSYGQFREGVHSVLA